MTSANPGPSGSDVNSNATSGVRAIRIHLPRGPGLILLSGLLFTVPMLYLAVSDPDFLRLLDRKIYDVLLRANHSADATGSVCIVDIDKESLAAFGQWPWPRYRVALLLEKIAQSGALSVGLDMVFVEPDRTSPGALVRDLSRDLGLDVRITGIPDDLWDNDRILARTLSDGPFVLGYRFDFRDTTDAEGTERLHPVSVAIKRPAEPLDDSEIFHTGRGLVSSQEVLSRASTSSGFINAIADIDGTVRRTPLLIKNRDRFYPSLPLATFLSAFGDKQLFLSLTPRGIESMRIGSTVIPTDTHGNLLIHYRGKKGSFDYISARDLLNDRVPRARLENKVVFLGTSAEDLEYRTTPFGRLFPGVEIHATVVDNMLGKDFLSESTLDRWWVYSLVLASGIASTLLLTWTRSVRCGVILGVCVIGIWLWCDRQFAAHGVYVSPLFPLITLAGNFSILSLLKYWNEERKVRSRNEELAVTQQATIQSLASLAETRDNDTGGHIRRTQRYIKLLAECLRDHRKFRSYLDDETIDLLFLSAPLHDAGKVGIPDNILLKPGKLDEKEFERMKDHTTLGGDAIKVAEEQLGQRSFLRFAREIAYSHQEKWDGSGYPEGLKGDSIPVSGRLMAIADVYDALISRRVYKKPYPHHVAVNAIAMGRGTHFDPDMIDAFLRVKDQFRDIALELSDTDEQRRVLLQSEDG